MRSPQQTLSKSRGPWFPGTTDMIRAVGSAVVREQRRVEAEPVSALRQTTGGSVMRGCRPWLDRMADASVSSKGMTAGLVILICVIWGGVAAADEALETKQLVEKARFTLE